MFGGKKHDDFDDAALIRAARQRLIREIKAQHSSAAQQRIVNNVYGGGGGSGGGLADKLGGAGEDPYDYMVDIERRDVPGGWDKKVKRYRTPKDEKKK